MSRTSRSRTPVHLALPTSLPPTSLLTHAIVTYCSNIGMRDELVPGQHRLAIDQAVDPQRPCRGGDAGDEERRVDPVEAVVRHDDRGQAADRRGEVHRGVERRGEHRGRRDGVPIADRGDLLALQERRPTTPATTAAAVTPPARIRNDRLDQSGIAAVPSVGCTGGSPMARSSQPRTHSPAPTEIPADVAPMAGLASGSPSDARNPTTPNSDEHARGEPERADGRGRRGRPRWPARPRR